LPWQKQHCTDGSFDQQFGLKCKEETSKVLHLDHSFVWSWNLDSFESRSELLRSFWNEVLQKHSGDQLERSFEKRRIITKNRGEKEHPTHNKTKQTWLDRHQFTTLNQQNTQTFSLDIYVIFLHRIFLYVSICKGPSSGNLFKTISHKATPFRSCNGVKWSNV
jgi:hypothetical protein